MRSGRALSVLDYIDYIKWCFTQLPNHMGPSDPMPAGADTRCRGTLNRWRQDKVLSGPRHTEWMKLQSNIAL